MKTPRRSCRVSRRRGASLMEIVTASGITTFVMFSLIMMVLTGMKTWTHGQSEIDADLSSQIGIRSISSALREAMYVQIDGNGRGISFRVPKRDGAEYKIPTEWDGVERRIYLDSDTGSIMLKEAGEPRVIARHVVTTDPSNSNAAYSIFSTGSTGVIRQVTIMLVSQNSSAADCTSFSRIRETVYLRNVPIMTQ